MHKLLLLLLSITFSVDLSSQNGITNIPKEIDFELLRQERGEINYDFNELVEILEGPDNKLEDPEIISKANEYEKALIFSRSFKNKENPNLRINTLKYLLEFKFYRSPQEKQLINFYMAKNFGWTHSPRMASQYLTDSILVAFDHIENDDIRYNLLGEFASQLNMIDSCEFALKGFRGQLKIALAENDSSKLAKSRNNYAYMHQRLHNYDSAEYYYAFNKNAAFKKIEPIYHAFAFGNCGVIKMFQNEPDTAIKYLKREVDILNSLNETSGLDNAFYIIGICYKKIDQLDSAKKYIRLCLAHSDLENKVNQKDIIKYYKLLLSLSAIEIGDEQLENNLSTYFDLTQEYNESIINKSIQEELKITQQLKQFNDITSTKLFLEKLESNNKQLTYTIGALVCLFILVILYLVTRYKNRQKLAKANKELKEKNHRLEKLYHKESDTNKMNETLLMELHHRVKNNLQMISSLFNLQLNAYGLEDSTSNFLRKAQSRVQSISMVHKKMYQSSQVNEMDFSDYLNSFTSEIINTELAPTKIAIEMDQLYLSINFAVPLGLVFNELLTNSLKYVTSEKEIHISIKHFKQEDEHVFIYTDNGEGIKLDNFQNDKSESIGLTLIQLLADQMNASIEYREAQAGKHGFWFRIKGQFKEE